MEGHLLVLVKAYPKQETRERPLEEDGAEKAKTRNFGRAEAISSPRPALEGWHSLGHRSRSACP